MPFDLPAFIREGKEEISDELDVECGEAADWVLQASQIYLDEINKTTDTGELAGSGEVEHLAKGVWAVIYDAPHAKPIEYGSRPHMPPRGVLVNWARRKLGLSKKEAIKAANRIRWKIFMKGTEAQPFLRPPLNQLVAEGKFKYVLI